MKYKTRSKAERDRDQYDVTGLSHNERELLKADILKEAAKDDASFGAAQAAHKRRVGQKGLRAYVDSLK